MNVKHKKRSHREASSDSSSDESPQRQKHKKQKSKHRKEHSRHHEDDDYPKKHKKSRRKDEDESSSSPIRKDSFKNSHSNKREKKDRRKSRERSTSPIRIKKEEDFDRRQEELRRRRRRENAPREERRHHPGDIRIKQEPEEDNRHRQRNERRNRNDIEQERRQNDARRAEAWQRREREGRGQNAEALIEKTEEEPKEKEKPNLGLSGALTEDTNTFRGVVIKYNEPPEARIPKKKWRLYPFKGDEALKVLHLHRQSAYLLGKMRRIVDIPIDHPSCSKQHAVFQFRMVETEKDDGRRGRTIKPYIIDLDSSNGTFVNNQKIEPRRYVELKEKDVIKFAFSSREYVLIHDKSDTTEVKGSSSEEEDSD